MTHRQDYRRCDLFTGERFLKEPGLLRGTDGLDRGSAALFLSTPTPWVEKEPGPEATSWTGALRQDPNHLRFASPACPGAVFPSSCYAWGADGAGSHISAPAARFVPHG